MKIIILFYLCGALQAADIYYAQTSAGGNTGANCANAFALLDGTNGINRAAVWLPGNTLHVCGAITSGPGTGVIASQADGSNGNPVTLLFETGANLKAPYWGTNDGTNPTSGAITVNNNYVVVDLGTNGLIQNTLNGTSGAACPGGTCTDQNITSAIVINGGLTNVEIKSAAAGGTIADMYDKTPCSSDAGVNSYGVFVYQGNGGTVSNLLVHDLTMHDMIGGFSGGYSAWSNVSIYNNVMSRMSIEIGMGDRGNNSTISGLNIYNNQLFDNYVWWDTGDVNHLNAMHPFAVHSGSTITGVAIYNNYVHGDFGAQNCGSTGHQTAAFFVEGGGTSGNIFNNIIVSNGTGDYPSNGYIVVGAPYGIYNNTIIGNTTGAYAISNGSGTVGVENNLVSTVDAFEQQFSTSTLTSDYNLFYNGSSSPFLYGASASTRLSYATWLSDGFDAHTQTSNPNVSGTWPASGIGTLPAYAFPVLSPIVNNGTNLTGLAIAALNLDASGHARPSSGAWTIGAYNFIPSFSSSISGKVTISGKVQQ